MIFEFLEEDRNFIINLIARTHVAYLIKNIEDAKTSAACDEYLECELSKDDASELAGQLCFEANHNRKKSVRDRAGDIADSLGI